jgi:hypothetical protein
MRELSREEMGLVSGGFTFTVPGATFTQSIQGGVGQQTLTVQGVSFTQSTQGGGQQTFTVAGVSFT